MKEFPEWATPKQIEGMKEFVDVSNEYGCFKVAYKQSDWGDEDETRFYAVVTWGSTNNKGCREHTFDIAYDYEPTWDYLNEPIEFWQFLFAGGDCTREISTEVFFLELFQYLDGIANTQPAIE